MGGAAISRRLTDEFLRRWLTANPEGSVTTRDLAKIVIPLVDAEWVSAQYTPEESRTHRQQDLLKLSTRLVAELLDADECVIGMPMHNWGPPASFKLWVDHIVTPRTSSERPLAGKRVTFIVAAGQVFGPQSPNASKNHLAPWLRTVFGFLGSKDIRFVLADGTREMHNGKISRSAFLAQHHHSLDALFRAVADQQPASDSDGPRTPHA
jgi:FMN-dependent NADH-azoreductase